MATTALSRMVSQELKDVSPQQLLKYAIPLVAAYPFLVSFLRFRRMKWMQKKYNYPDRDSFARMTGEEAWEIQKVLLQFEFPFFFLKALQFALFRTYGIPTISKVLVKTSQFSRPETSMKRYADTAVLVQEFVGHAPSAARGRSAVARTRFIHSGYRSTGTIREEDMLYTLGLFAIQPVRFIDMYEWRQLTDMEKCAIGAYWKSLGDALEISYNALPSGKTVFRDGLHWLEEMMVWCDDYEARCMVPDTNNRKTADETTKVLMYMIPKPFQHFGLKFVLYMMDDRLRKAMLYDSPPASYAKVFSFFLATRRFVMRHLALPRPYFMRYTTFTESQGEDERIFNTQWDAEPYYVKPTFWNRWGPTAWLTWALGRPLPGDEGDKYYPNGYYIPDVGPKYFEGKGRHSQEKTMEELKISRTGGCPFG